MELIAEPYRALPCALKVFKINGKDADIDDFGDSRDNNPGGAERWECADRRFFPREFPTEAALAYYAITETEWDEITSELESILAVGHCGWCV